MSNHATPHDDPVARNRATDPRRTPDRTQLGDDTLRTVMRVAAAAVALATLLLVMLLTT